MKENIPLFEDERKNKRIELFPACSTSDCTGLIPAAPEDEDELEAYKDMYNFTAPDIPPHE